MKAAIYDKATKSMRDGLSEIPAPIPGRGEVLVKVMAVSLNAADYRSMAMGLIPKGGVFGADVAGVVEAVGEGVATLKPGDEVVADTSGCGFGGLAEYAVAPERLASLKPSNVDFSTAAALPIAAVTALQALRSAGGLQPGARVLVYGASGGVGSFAVQLARHHGANVTAFCGADYIETAKALGAEAAYDYRSTRLDAIEGGYDAILGVHGKLPLWTYLQALSERGVYVAVGGAVSQIFAAMLLGPLLARGGKKARALAAKPSKDDLGYVLDLVSKGAVKPRIEKTYPLSQAAEAMRYVASGRAKGKVVVVP